MKTIRTRLYRVALWGAQALTIGLFLFDRFGPGIGLTTETIGTIDAIASAAIVFVRQIGDATTPTLPAKGDVVLPPTDGS